MLTEPGGPDLITELVISNLPMSEVGRVLEVLREAGYTVEINLEVSIGSRRT